MPRMTVPLPGPSATVPSMAFGDLDGSSFWLAFWITSSPTLTVYLSPSKVTVIPLKLSIGISMPPATTDSTVQVPWNFLSSFSTSALSPARAPVPPDAVSTNMHSSVASTIRIRVLLYLRLTCVLGGAPTLLGRCRTNDHRPAAGALERHAIASDGLVDQARDLRASECGRALQVNRARLVAGPLQQFHRIRQFLTTIEVQPDAVRARAD